VECPKCLAENKEGSRFCSHCATPLTPPPGDGPTLAMATPLPAIREGAIVAGKYRVVGEVGRGGMGVVYKAEDLKLKRPVALKFLPPHLMDAPELKERFLIEAQAAAALSHPNICVIYEVGETEDHPYIAMEFVEGETLREKVKRGPLEPAEALDIAAQVAAGLGEAHRKDIVHRDVKSANIMVTAKGQAKVMDFGLAKLQGGSSLTKSQTTVGTIAYMSPEQARGGELDGRTDIWSLGIVLFEMLTGKLPFAGDHDQTVIYSILQREPEPLLKARPGLAPELAQIVGQALVKKPDDRYKTMEEFREDIASVAEGFKPIRAKLVRKIFGVRTAYVYSGLAVVLALGMGLNVGGVRDRLLGRSPASDRAVKLAVMPFANLTGDPEQEYLSDGLTQEMITRLGSLNPEDLSVIARSSVMRYKKSDTPIDQIGRELGVDYILEGSTRREKNRVRITTELIQAGNQTQLWADTFERDLSDILTVQSEVAQNVAKALRIELLPDEQTRLAAAGTVDPEAYDAYLKGSYHWQKQTPMDQDTAQRYFELALEKDPSYAPAHAGLAWVWSTRQQMGITPPREAGPKAREAALKAVELDADDAGSREALALVKTWTDWDWKGAEPEWRRALELNANSANTNAYFASYLTVVGRPEEALRHAETAVGLDPFNALFQALYAQVLTFNRRYDEALTAAQAALEAQPELGIAGSAYEDVLCAKDLRDEHLELVRKQVAVDPERLAKFERGLTEGGYEGALRAVAEDAAGRYESFVGGMRAFDVACRYLRGGDPDRAFEWLERSYEERDPNLIYLGKPLFDSVRDDPRFRELLRKMNLARETAVSLPLRP
jgi:eukaryotic-like serine/threonine-protein kinase